MRFEELLVEADAELRRMRYREAALSEHGLTVACDERMGPRRAMAAMVVRIGAWLDNEAAERFVVARRAR